jgi:hypothetical protein
MASTEDTKFPVFFPVSREFGWRKIRTGLRPPPSHKRLRSALFTSFFPIVPRGGSVEAAKTVAWSDDSFKTESFRFTSPIARNVPRPA